MTTALAPAAMALSALTEKKQPPRWISAMCPFGKPVKSAASQPLPVPVALGSTGVAAVVTSPAPEYWSVWRSGAGVNVFGFGAVTANDGADRSSQKSKVKFWTCGVYPARLSWSAMYFTVILLPGSPAARLPPLASAIFSRFNWWCRTTLSVTSEANFDGVGAAWAPVAVRVVAASDRPRNDASAALRITRSPMTRGTKHPKPGMCQKPLQGTNQHRCGR